MEQNKLEAMMYEISCSLGTLFWSVWQRNRQRLIDEHCLAATSTALTAQRLTCRWFESLSYEDVDEQLEEEMARVFGLNKGHAFAANLLSGHKRCNILSLLVWSDRPYSWWPNTRQGWDPPIINKEEPCTG